MNPLMLELLPWAHRGHCCSQLMMLLLLQSRGEENPGLVRALQGLCHGIGQSDGPCGLLTGGAALLAYLSGMGGEGEEADRMLTPMLNDYATWFYERTAAYGGHSCGQVSAGLGAAGPDGMPDPAVCGDLLAECWERLLEILQSYGVDPMKGV